ncbi:uncharacterized protein BDR25DRAFT_46673 [Lindgomyces ingoldianus]|uniref:Uncharacterized protein n=1 Tax=Lindgomyces ingoldianus TaxID=673940 RepID=A0ACB6QS20_9PLEO|nr:uncharacterized protein BDR25DRAFT_46673 [Lindgomyces ingoldianus]KAF2469637.1 hypothetical protein BDR25DRAFT_46673 [Lindgomyces ingoldianus]
MYTLLVVVLLIAFLFEPAVATSPVMDATLLTTPMEPSYPDPEGILTGFCEFCGFFTHRCVHVMGNGTWQRPFTPSTFLDHPEWPRDYLPVLPASSPELEPQLPYYTSADRQTLKDEVVRQLEENATNVQEGTVQAHIEDIYTPGDRTTTTAGSQRATHRRQAPRPGGFPCSYPGCGKPFNRQCDLKRHSKTHQPRSERPHKCSVCNEGFLYPKDRNRHERTHDQSSSPETTLYCPVEGCNNRDGFSRRDNLLRHQRKQHPRLHFRL